MVQLGVGKLSDPTRSEKFWVRIGSGGQKNPIGWNCLNPRKPDRVETKNLGKNYIFTLNSITQTHIWHTHISHEYRHWVSNSHSHRNRIQITVQSTDSQIYSNSQFNSVIHISQSIHRNKTIQEFSQFTPNYSVFTIHRNKSYKTIQ